MGDNTSKKLSSTLGSLAITPRQLAPALAAIDSLKINPALLRVSADLARHQEIMRTTLGSLQIQALLPGTAFHAEMEKARQALAAYESRFRMPALEEIARITEQFRSGPLADVIRKQAESATMLARAMEGMRLPWIDTTHPLRSLGGFAELQAIGQAVNRMPAFTDGLAAVLRSELGDWRDKITWPETIFTDLDRRSEFYAARGFNPALTEFPAATFADGLTIAQLKRRPPTLVKEYGAPVPPAADREEEEALSRTNQAHDWLQRLETHMRRYIDNAMTATFGPDWPRHRLPNGLYDLWLEKKNAAEQGGGRSLPLISYADFRDYEAVICKKDNWRQVFAQAFVRQESIRETFQRLYPIRICTMHARPITQDDQLLLYVETRRILKVVL